MTKQITIYEPNAQGVIIKKVGTSYEDAEVIDGEVINEGFENADSAWARVCSAFRASQSIPKQKPYNDNGREFNSVTGNWEYTADANGDVNPFHCDYEAPQDGQGSVPVWDGYSGQ